MQDVGMKTSADLRHTVGQARPDRVTVLMPSGNTSYDTADVLHVM